MAAHTAPGICILSVEHFDLQIYSLRLVQYQLALYQIDSMRKDGKFIGADGTIPEGQAIVVAHLNECHELVEEVSSYADCCFVC